MHEAARVIQSEHDGAPSWLYTSNFQRSFQSALVLREDLGMLFSQLRTEFSGLLDPRKMGDLDYNSSERLRAVWEGDALDPTNTPPPVPTSLQPSASVESPRDVYRRALECFTRLESTYYGEDVILVSHQDTLSIFTASLMGTPLTDHHKDWGMELGEVRCLDLSGVPAGRAKNFAPTDLRGDYAVGDAAANYL
jgi:broad specificity phosphatase PhoE